MLFHAHEHEMSLEMMQKLNSLFEAHWLGLNRIEML